MATQDEIDQEAGKRAAIACGFGREKVAQPVRPKSQEERISDYISSTNRSAPTQQMSRAYNAHNVRSFPELGRPYTHDEINSVMSGVAIKEAQARGVSRQRGYLSLRHMTVGNAFSVSSSHDVRHAQRSVVDDAADHWRRVLGKT